MLTVGSFVEIVWGKAGAAVVGGGNRVGSTVAEVGKIVSIDGWSVDNGLLVDEFGNKVIDVGSGVGSSVVGVGEIVSAFLEGIKVSCGSELDSVGSWLANAGHCVLRFSIGDNVGKLITRLGKFGRLVGKAVGNTLDGEGIMLSEREGILVSGNEIDG